MKRPAALIMLAGHPLIAVGSYGLLAWIGLAWWQGDATNGIALAALILALACGKSFQRAEHYRSWQREWAIMGGQRPPGWVSYTTMRRCGAGAAWLAFATLSLHYAGNREIGWAANLFWFANLVGATGLAWRRWRRRASRHRSQTDAVTLCIGLPRQAPTLQQAYAAVPAYCRQLMGYRTSG